MDRISIAGLALGLAEIVGGLMLEGGHPASLLQVTAFLVVVGGTAGAVMLQSSAQQFSDAMRMARWVFKPPVHEPKKLIGRVSGWSQIARRSGLLALETAIDASREPFERKGLQLLVDGAEPNVLREALELELNAFEARHRAAARVWEAAGGYAPTVGILGAVMGLIQVMENLTDPAKLGAGIAVAFVATIYGVGLANLVFLPIANKIKTLVAREVSMREMLTPRHVPGRHRFRRPRDLHRKTVLPHPGRGRSHSRCRHQSQHQDRHRPSQPLRSHLPRDPTPHRRWRTRDHFGIPRSWQGRRPGRHARLLGPGLPRFQFGHRVGRRSRGLLRDAL
jgi:chemotaxis protein MotA